MTPRAPAVSKNAMQLVKLSILGVIAGFFAVLIFHQSLWYLLNLVGLIPLRPPGLAARSAFARLTDFISYLALKGIAHLGREHFRKGDAAFIAEG